MAEVRDQSDAEWLTDYEGKKPEKAVPHALNEHKPLALLSEASTNKKQAKSAPRRQVPKIVAPDDLPVVIPEGSYTAKCHDYRFSEYWGKSRLTLKFEISQGRYAQIHLECFYNLDRKKNPNGEYILVPKPRSAYVRQMKQMFYEISEVEGEWLSPENLLSKTFRVEVVTVTKNHERKALGSNQYSKIKTNIELLHE